MSQVAKNVKRYGRDDRPGDHARSGILSRAEPQQHRWLPPRLPAGTDTVHRGAFEVLGQDNRDAYIGVGIGATRQTSRVDTERQPHGCTPRNCCSETNLYVVADH
jgi:hypothetical protein